MDIFDTILACLDRGSSGVLATVVRRTGSAPRDVGAKMFVTGHDGIFGTVGGGQLEADTYGKAVEMIGKDVAMTFSINMNAARVEDKDMLCGGNVDLLLEPVAERYRGVYEAVRKCRQERMPAIVLTRFDPGVFAKSLVRGDGTVAGDPLDRDSIDRCMGLLHRCEPELSGNTFAEPVRIVVPLYIFGAGHVSQHLSKVAKGAGFFVTIVDDRGEFANTERFGDADNIIVAPFSDAFDFLDFTGKEYVVILTRSHEYDAMVLEEALKKDTRYIGMMGSARKVGIILDRLHEKGFDREVTADIHAPVGIDINAETPHEIAVSIAAELIKVKNET